MSAEREPWSRDAAPGASRGGVGGGRLVLLSLAASAALVVGYLAAGGSGYKPTVVADPCAPREWTAPQGVDEYAQQFTLSALDGAACELGVSRETLDRGARDHRLARAVRRRATGSSPPSSSRRCAPGWCGRSTMPSDAGALDPTAAVGLRAVAERLPVETAIGLIEDARRIFEGGQGVVDSLGGLLDEAGNLLP